MEILGQKDSGRIVLVAWDSERPGLKVFAAGGEGVCLSMSR